MNVEVSQHSYCIEGTLATYGIHVIVDLPVFKNLIRSSHGNPLLIL